MTERHPSVEAALEEVEKLEDPGRKLRWKIRILVQHYACHRQDDFQIFMGHWAVIWQLNGRQGLSLAERLFLVDGAMTNVQQLLANDPEDPELSEAMGYCTELHNRVCDEIQKELLVQSAKEDFSEWAKELETPETSETSDE